MNLLVIIALGFALLVGAVLAVGVTAGRARARESRRIRELAGLSKLRSPSGKAFFPTDDSALELAELLDDVDARRRREAER